MIFIILTNKQDFVVLAKIALVLSNPDINFMALIWSEKPTNVYSKSATPISNFFYGRCLESHPDLCREMDYKFLF